MNVNVKKSQCRLQLLGNTIYCDNSNTETGPPLSAYICDECTVAPPPSGILGLEGGEDIVY